MAYYDALKTAWAALPSGDTTAQKLTAINAATVAGPAQDVPIGDVVAYLALQGKLSGLQAYVMAGTGNATALTAAKELLTLLSTPSVTVFRMSNAETYATVQNFLEDLAADSGSGSGITSADVTNLLALAATAEPWWQSAGYTSPISLNDLEAAGGLT